MSSVKAYKCYVLFETSEACEEGQIAALQAFGEYADSMQSPWPQDSNQVLPYIGNSAMSKTADSQLVVSLRHGDEVDRLKQILQRVSLFIVDQNSTSVPEVPGHLPVPVTEQSMESEPGTGAPERLGTSGDGTSPSCAMVSDGLSMPEIYFDIKRTRYTRWDCEEKRWKQEVEVEAMKIKFTSPFKLALERFLRQASACIYPTRETIALRGNNFMIELAVSLYPDALKAIEERAIGNGVHQFNFGKVRYWFTRDCDAPQRDPDSDEDCGDDLLKVNCKEATERTPAPPVIVGPTEQPTTTVGTMVDISVGLSESSAYPRQYRCLITYEDVLGNRQQRTALMDARKAVKMADEMGKSYSIEVRKEAEMLATASSRISEILTADADGALKDILLLDSFTNGIPEVGQKCKLRMTYRLPRIRDNLVWETFRYLNAMEIAECYLRLARPIPQDVLRRANNMITPDVVADRIVSTIADYLNTGVFRVSSTGASQTTCDTAIADLSREFPNKMFTRVNTESTTDFHIKISDKLPQEQEQEMMPEPIMSRPTNFTWDAPARLSSTYTEPSSSSSGVGNSSAAAPSILHNRRNQYFGGSSLR